MKQFQAPKRPPATPKSAPLWRAGFARFRKEEDGVMVGFTIFLIIMMVTIGGIGADIMMAEMRRTKLQHTLDRAVLAAADMDQTRSSQAVVEDYFAKSGLDHAGVEIDETNSSSSMTHRRVAADAAVSSNMAYSTIASNFRRLRAGEPAEESTSLTIGASGIAEESIGNVEISLVLDVSGSMNNNSRLYNLKIAAKEFIDTMDENTEDGTMSVSIVPYAAQVSVPDEVIGALQTAGENSEANCLNFDASDYLSTSINPSVTYDRTMHFTWSGSESDRRDNGTVVSDGYIDCNVSSSRELAILQDDTTALKNYIDALQGGGNTSIDVGMKWGTALLDPAFQPVVTNLIDDSDLNTGTISNDFSGRPYAFEDHDTLKVVVLMSDGQNTRQHFIEDGYREGDSPVWYNEQEDYYSIYLGFDVEDKDGDTITDEPSYFWPSENRYEDHAYGEGTYEETEWVDTDECESWRWSRRKGWRCSNYVQVAHTVTVDEPGHAEVVSYPDLWAYSPSGFIAEHIYRPLLGSTDAWNEWHHDAINDVSYGTKDDRTRDICDAAKAEEVIVYTIGFEAPDAARVVLQDCASSDSHYFDVEGLEIRDAFAAIATSIRQLRLIQ